MCRVFLATRRPEINFSVDEGRAKTALQIQIWEIEVLFSVVVFSTRGQKCQSGEVDLNIN